MDMRFIYQAQPKLLIGVSLLLIVLPSDSWLSSAWFSAADTVSQLRTDDFQTADQVPRLCMAIVWMFVVLETTRHS